MNALERLILHCFQRQPISNRHAHDPRINAVCDYLNAHIAQEVKIETLAAMVFISPSRLAHLFKNELGQTVYAWRETQRINRARWLIQSTSLPLNKIALSVGYSDPVYFTRLFRKHNGIPPGEYRKRYAEMKGCNINGSHREPSFTYYVLLRFRLCHLSLQTQHLTIDFGHH